MSVSEAIPGASRLRNQNEILIEKSDEAFKNNIKKRYLVPFLVRLHALARSNHPPAFREGKISPRKFWEEVKVKSRNFLLKPLTLALSPLAGRGDSMD